MAVLKLSMILNAVDRATGPIRRVGAALKSLDRSGGGMKILAGYANAAGRGLGFAAQQASRLAAAAGAITGAGVTALGFGVVKAGSEYEDFLAVLEGTERGLAPAKKAMSDIRAFAKATPYDVAGVTRAFVQMRSLGIDASRRAMTAYGDVAASRVGKTMIDVVEAVADATMGEWERLKEFGVKASAKGSQVVLSYATATGRASKTVKKDAAAIEQALIGIFEQMAGGTMKRKSATLGGVLSNLGDVWNTFLLQVGGGGAVGGQGGVFDWIKARAERLLKFLETSDGGKLAKRISDALIRGLETIERAVAKVDFAKLIEDLAKLAAFAVSVVDALGGIGGVIDWLVGGAIGHLGYAVTAVAAAIATALGAATAPVWLIGAAITGLVAAGYWLWRNWEKIGSWWSDFWGGLSGTVAKAWDAAFRAVVDGVGAIGRWLAANWRMLIPAPLAALLEGGRAVAGVFAAGGSDSARAPAVNLAGGRAGRGAPQQLQGRIEVALTGPGAQGATVRKAESSAPGVDLRASRGLRLQSF